MIGAHRAIALATLARRGVALQPAEATRTLAEPRHDGGSRVLQLPAAKVPGPSGRVGCSIPSDPPTETRRRRRLSSSSTAAPVKRRARSSSFGTGPRRFAVDLDAEPRTAPRPTSGTRFVKSFSVHEVAARRLLVRRGCEASPKLRSARRREPTLLPGRRGRLRAGDPRLLGRASGAHLEARRRGRRELRRHPVYGGRAQCSSTTPTRRRPSRRTRSPRSTT